MCEKYRGYIDGLIAAAGGQDCEWGVNVEAGWFCLLPHLGRLRHSARVIRFDAYRCIAEGSSAGAAERIAAIIRMSDQTRSDRILISSLVGTAICAVGLNLTDEMLKQGQVSPAAARTILAAIRSIKRDDLWGSVSALQGERYLSVEWVRAHYKGEHAGVLFMRDVRGMGADEEPMDGFIYSMNEERLSADLDRFGKYFDAAAAALRSPDNVVRLSELGTEVWEGQYGLVARVMSPAMGRVARSINRTRRDLERTTRELEAIVLANETPPPASNGGQGAK
jgi:hypothetical protein